MWHVRRISRILCQRGARHALQRAAAPAEALILAACPLDLHTWQGAAKHAELRAEQERLRDVDISYM